MNGKRAFLNCKKFSFWKFQFLSLMLLRYNQNFGIRISGVQFIFWMLLVICGIPHLRTLIESIQTRDDLVPYHFTSYITFFVLSTAIWLLNWFADAAPSSTKYVESDVSECMKRKVSTITIMKHSRNHAQNYRPAIHRVYSSHGSIL